MLLSLELTDTTLLWYPRFPRLPKLDHSFLVTLRLSANLAVLWGLRFYRIFEHRELLVLIYYMFMIYETKEIHGLYFSSESRFDFRSVNGIKMEKLVAS